MSDTAVETIPQAGVWDIDEVHSSLEFVVRHLMATKVRGRFSEWTATLTTGSTPGDAKVEATIQAANVTTFSATTELEREKWNLTWNQPLDKGGFVLGKTITVEVEVQFVLRKEEQK